MSKPLIILLVVGLLLGVLLAGGYWYVSKNSTKPIQPVPIVETSPSVSPTTVPLETYENPSGFSFQHPESVTVKENKDSSASYASIMLTSKEAPGSISLQVTDTKSKSASDWLKANKIATKDADVTDVAFADIEATQVASETGILAVSYDKGAVFIIRTDWKDDQDFWQGVYDTLLSTFAFTAPEEPTSAPASSGGGDASSGDVIFEGEEIIE